MNKKYHKAIINLWFNVMSDLKDLLCFECAFSVIAFCGYNHDAAYSHLNTHAHIH